MGVNTAVRAVQGFVRDKKRLKRITNALNEVIARGEQSGLVPAVRGFDLGWREHYPELGILEEQHHLIQAECERLLQARDQLPDVESLGGSYTKGGIHSARWKSFMFKSGKFIPENCRWAPHSAELLRSIPNLYTAFFSILEPHQYITPHWGYWKGFVRFHLGVIIPNDNRDQSCWLRINSDTADNAKHDTSLVTRGEKYYWKNGEGMLFDDTYLHDAMNESDQTRVVLWLDLARRMPAALHALNSGFLKVAHTVPSITRIRKQALVKLDRLPDPPTRPASR